MEHHTQDADVVANTLIIRLNKSVQAVVMEILLKCERMLGKKNPSNDFFLS